MSFSNNKEWAVAIFPILVKTAQDDIKGVYYSKVFNVFGEHKKDWSVAVADKVSGIIANACLDAGLPTITILLCNKETLNNGARIDGPLKAHGWPQKDIDDLMQKEDVRNKYIKDVFEKAKNFEYNIVMQKLIANCK